MKRREFVVAAASAGVVGGFLPARARGATPCPPPTISVEGGQSVSTGCVVAPPGSAPAWFLNTPEGTWTAIAGNSGQRIVDKLPGPVPFNGAGQVAGNPSSITTAWTGGAVDQTRGEYILCANGGHADYPGNEAYALSLRDATPSWRRLSDPTPNGSLIFNDSAGGPGALNADGRPRAMHSTFEVFANGRVWFPFQNSYASPSGGSSAGVYSYNRDALGAGTSSLPWTSGNLGPWQIHSKINFPSIGFQDLSSVIFGVAAFDRVTNKIWALGGNSANYTVYWSVDTLGASLGQSQVWSKGQSFGHWGTWVAVAHDLRILVAGDHLRNVITVLDLTKAGQSGDWQQVSNVTGTGFFPSGGGGVYLAASRSIACGDPRALGRGIRNLRIPTKVVDGQVVYDRNGQWVWTSLSPAGPNISVPPGNSAPYSKWNIVENMGNGQSAIVLATDISGPTYVYRVPMAGI
jgi:hypothetical protein